MRGRGHRQGGGGGGGSGGGGSVRHHSTGNIPLNRNHVFDSSGPDIRIRGTSQQLFEKYLQLGRDATSGGDRVTAEAYFQHAEHYFRILNAMNQAAQQNQQGQQNGQQNGQQGGHRRNYQGNSDMQGADDIPTSGSFEPEEAEGRLAGLGDQPESREIPIIAAGAGRSRRGAPSTPLTLPAAPGHPRHRSSPSG